MNGQRRFGQELLGQQEPSREQQLDRRNAELLLHDAANLPRAELELICDILESGLVIERSFFETLNDELGDSLSVIDGSASRRELGTAPQARPEAGELGFLRCVEEAAIGLLGCFRGADRAAVHIGRRDAHEEHAVEPPIAGCKGAVESSLGLVHTLTIRAIDPVV